MTEWETDRWDKFSLQVTESSRSGKFVLFWQYVSSSELANRISFIAKYKTMKIYCPDAGGKGSPKMIHGI